MILFRALFGIGLAAAIVLALGLIWTLLHSNSSDLSAGRWQVAMTIWVLILTVVAGGVFGGRRLRRSSHTGWANVVLAMAALLGVAAAVPMAWLLLWLSR